MTILFSVGIANAWIKETKKLTIINFSHLQKQVDLT